MVGNPIQPRVVVVVKLGCLREHFDGASQGPLRIQNFSAWPVGVLGTVFIIGIPTIAIFPIKYLVQQIEILLLIGHENRAVDHVVGQTFTDFTFAATADGARLMAKYAFADGSYQPP